MKGLGDVCVVLFCYFLFRHSFILFFIFFSFFFLAEREKGRKREREKKRKRERERERERQRVSKIITNQCPPYKLRSADD